MRQAFWLFLAAALLAGCAAEMAGGQTTGTNLDPAAGGDAGGLFGIPTDDPGEGIPLKGEGPEPAAKHPAAVSPKAAVIKPVEITKKNDLGTCVIDKACEKKISAKGGSGEYRWSLVGGALPKGLELADVDKKKVVIGKAAGQEIDEVGEFSFTLKVEDAADAALLAERTFTLKIDEDIAMDLYTLVNGNDGAPEWTLVAEKDEEGNDLPVVVPPLGRLLAVVKGHAESYTWSIDKLSVACDATSCKGENEKIMIYKDTNLEPTSLPPHHQSIIIEAGEAFIGQEAQGVVIAAADAYGNQASKTIQSITYQQEPCKIPITVSGPGKVYVDENGQYEATYAVSGGQGPYSYRVDMNEGSGEWETKSEGAYTTKKYGLYASKTTKIDGDTFTISGKGSLGIETIADLGEKELLVRQIVVTDSCNSSGDAPREFTNTLVVTRKKSKVKIDKVSALRIQLDLQDVNDTSSDGYKNEDTTYLLITVLSEGEELGEFYFDLDECGDNGSASNCEDIRTIEMAGNGDPFITEVDQIIMQFHDDVCFLCGDLDCDIQTIDFFTENWRTRYWDNESEGGYGNNDGVVDHEWGKKMDLIPKIIEHESASTLPEIWRSNKS